MSNQPDTVHWLKVGFDFVSTGTMLAFFFLIKYVGKPIKSGFYCNDFSINMPFKSSTVTNLYLILISLVMPFVLIALTELVRYLHARFSLKSTHSSYVYKIKLFRKILIQVPEQIGNFYVNFGSFFFGLAVTVVITDFTKILVGRLRPNFLDVCKPDKNPYTDLCANNNQITYLVPDVDFKCLSSDKKNVDESRLSFPSGHSSLTFYSMIYLILFINFTWNFRRFGLLPRLFQFLLLCLAIFTALSRIADNKHHPTDVLAGACIGTLISLVNFAHLSEFLKKNNYKIRYSSVRTSYDEENIQTDSFTLKKLPTSNLNISEGNINQAFNNAKIKTIN